VNSTPQPPCSDLREAYLVSEESTKANSVLVPHARECAECAQWLIRHRRLVGVLGALDRYPAPVELDSAVLDELIVGTARLVEGILELPRLHAPDELGEQLAKDLLGSPALMRALNTLKPLSAPSVLDRLVDEDLRDPAAVTRRFAGQLSRLSGPRGLAGRLEASLPSASSQRFVRGLLRFGAGGVAAALLVFVTLPLFKSSTNQVPSSRFVVVEVQSLASLDLLAQNLLTGLTGGNEPLSLSLDPPSGTDQGGGL
jgi:hypothetical protein